MYQNLSQLIVGCLPISEFRIIEFAVVANKSKFAYVNSYERRVATAPSTGYGWNSSAGPVNREKQAGSLGQLAQV